MKAWLPVVLAIVACSQPAVKKPDSSPPPPDDEGAAVAWQKAHPAPPLGPKPYNWEKIRERTLELKASPIGSLPCDYRGGPRPQTMRCTVPSKGRRPVKLAALVKHVKLGYPAGFQLELDIGHERLMIEQTWVFAVLGPEGQPVTEWVHPDDVRRWVTIVSFPSLPKVQTEDLRVIAMDIPP